nr:BREX-1 system adenine-specific DNA-methyltransferase PglX [Pseudorhodobacter wandonensis]
MTDSTYEAFSENPKIEDFGATGSGLQTSDNNRFLRQWFEVSSAASSFNSSSRAVAKESGKKWFPHKKGGPFRKWYGNNEFVLNWHNDGAELYEFAANLYGSPTRIIKNTDRYFTSGITWSHTTSSKFSARVLESNAIFNVEAPSLFDVAPAPFLCFLSSCVGDHLISISNPTLHFVSSSVGILPFASEKIEPRSASLNTLFNKAIGLSRADWDAYETSWDFTTLPLLSPDHRGETLENSYATLRAYWQSMTDEMQRLEEENNRIFIDAYGLQEELTPEVSLEEITLTCNPAYRYGVKNDVEANETRLRADTMAEFLHYAVGCMFGRYSLDAPGLILANQGETLEDYLARIPEQSFMPDADNVIPVLDGDWFADDIVGRARDFIRITFGEAKFRENLAFVEAALGKDLRKWFTKDFYDYHVRRYKKRPIYWMFASPKGSFAALIYMHRYRPDTVSVVLNQYLRDYIGKLENERARLEKLADDPTATPGQRTKALKDVGAVIKQIEELTAWERDVVYPMAQAKIAIDLDDGVKQNYPLFEGALKPIKGLEAADD